MYVYNIIGLSSWFLLCTIIKYLKYYNTCYIFIIYINNTYIMSKQYNYKYDL